jgi:hypothetical protein
MKRNENFLEAKKSENTVYLFRFGWKRKIRSEKKRNEAKKKINFSCERAKRMRNGSRFASFRFEAKKFLKRNRRTLIARLTQVQLFQPQEQLARYKNSWTCYNDSKNCCMNRCRQLFLF